MLLVYGLIRKTNYFINSNWIQIVILGFAQTRLRIYIHLKEFYGGDEYESSNDSFMEIGTSDEEFEAEEENNFIKKQQRTAVAINLIKKHN